MQAAPPKVVHQHQESGGGRHVPQEPDGLLLVQVVEEEGRRQDIVVFGDSVRQEVPSEKPHAKPLGVGPRLGIGHRPGVEIATVDLEGDGLAMGAPSQLQGHVAAAAGEVEQAQRPTGKLPRQGSGLLPEDRASRAQEIDAGQALEGLLVESGVQGEIVHDLGLPAPVPHLLSRR